MEHEIFSKSLNVTDTDITFDTVYKKDYIPVKYIEDIKKANCLIIPNENFRGEGKVLFPETTLEFFDYLRDNAGDSIITDIAISDEDFNKIELHSAAITIATFIVQYAILPIVTSLVTAFICDLVKKHRRKEEDTSAEVNIIVEETKTKKSKKISYKGPVSGVKEALDSVSEEIFKDE